MNFVVVSSVGIKWVDCTCANNVDPDMTAHNKPSHQDLHSLPFCFLLSAVTTVCISGYVPYQGWTSSLNSGMIGLKCNYGKDSVNHLKSNA